MKGLLPVIAVALQLVSTSGCNRATGRQPSKPPTSTNKQIIRDEASAEQALENGDTEAVSAYAKRLLAENSDPKAWYYGNVIHDANSFLGRAALREGRVKDAASYLVAAGKTPGSPQLDSFGPDFILARELLEKGKKGDVLKYLDLVEKFWAHTPESLLRRVNRAARESLVQMNLDHAKKLRQWKQEIKAGRIPKEW